MLANIAAWITFKDPAMSLQDKEKQEPDIERDGSNGKDFSSIFDDGETDIESSPPGSPVSVLTVESLNDHDADEAFGKTQSDLQVSPGLLNKWLLDAYSHMLEQRSDPIRVDESLSVSDWKKKYIHNLKITKKEQLREKMNLSNAVANHLVFRKKSLNSQELKAQAKFLAKWLPQLHEAIAEGKFDDPNRGAIKRVSEKENKEHRDVYIKAVKKSTKEFRKKHSKLAEHIQKKASKELIKGYLDEYNQLREKRSISRKQHNLRVTFKDAGSLEVRHSDSKYKDPFLEYNDPLAAMIFSQLQDRISQDQSTSAEIPEKITQEIERLREQYKRKLEMGVEPDDSRSVSARKSDCAKSLLSSSEVFYDKRIREQIILFNRLSEMLSDLCGVLASKNQSFQDKLNDIGHVDSSVIQFSASEREAAISKLYRLFLDINSNQDLQNIFIEPTTDFSDEETAQERAYVHLLMRLQSKQSIASTPILHWFSYHSLRNHEYHGLLSSEEVQKTLTEIHAWTSLMGQLNSIYESDKNNKLFEDIKLIQEKNISIRKKHGYLEKVIAAEKVKITQQKQQDWFEAFKSSCNQDHTSSSSDDPNGPEISCSASVKKHIQTINKQEDWVQAAQKFDELKKSVEDRWCIVPSTYFECAMLISVICIPYLCYSKYQEKQQDKDYINSLSMSKLVTQDSHSAIAQTIRATDTFFADKLVSDANPKKTIPRKYYHQNVVPSHF